MGLKFFDLKDLACDKAYEYFDKHVRKLPRNKGSGPLSVGQK